MFAFLFVCMSAMAQSTRVIKGAVIDKDGNPLPGAKVEATNGAESATVDADGTFSLEVSRWLKSATASYPGMYKKTMKVKDGDMIFQLDRDKGRWFLNLVSGYTFASSSSEGLAGGGAGLMFGRLTKLGTYAKVFWRITEKAQSEPAIPVVTAGVIKRLKPHLFLNAGVGYAKVNSRDDYYDEAESADGGVVELGLISNPLKHFAINCGFTTITDFDDFNYIIHLGVGYVF